MSSERLWISLLVLVAFAAGLAGGILLRSESTAQAGQHPFGPYLKRLVTEFELNAAQERDLGIALAEYGEKIDQLRDDSLSNKQLELIAAGEDCFSKIREYIIPIDRRAEFDRLLGGPPGASSTETKEIH